MLTVDFKHLCVTWIIYVDMDKFLFELLAMKRGRKHISIIQVSSQKLNVRRLAKQCQSLFLDGSFLCCWLLFALARTTCLWRNHPFTMLASGLLMSLDLPPKLTWSVLISLFAFFTVFIFITLFLHLLFNLRKCLLLIFLMLLMLLM